MKRAITTLASLAVLATAGPISGASAATAVGQPSKFSDRFLTSLEEVVDADASIAVVETDTTEENALMMEEGNDRRRLSWWSFALMMGRCFVGDFYHYFISLCHDLYYLLTAFFITSSLLVDKLPHPHPPPPSSKETNNGGSTATVTYESNNNYTEEKANIAPGTAPFIAIVSAAAAAVAALLALAVAAKRRRKPEYHQLRGSVRARMNLFSGFANRCFEDRAASGLQDVVGEEGLQVV